MWYLTSPFSWKCLTITSFCWGEVLWSSKSNFIKEISKKSQKNQVFEMYHDVISRYRNDDVISPSKDTLGLLHDSGPVLIRKVTEHLAVYHDSMYIFLVNLIHGHSSLQNLQWNFSENSVKFHIDLFQWNFVHIWFWFTNKFLPIMLSNSLEIFCETTENIRRKLHGKFSEISEMRSDLRGNFLFGGVRQ